MSEKSGCSGWGIWSIIAVYEILKLIFFRVSSHFLGVTYKSYISFCVYLSGALTVGLIVVIILEVIWKLIQRIHIRIPRIFLAPLYYAIFSKCVYLGDDFARSVAFSNASIIVYSGIYSVFFFCVFTAIQKYIFE